MKLNYEILFSNALTGLIENNGGSIEEALDYIGVNEDLERAVIKNWYGWDEDYCSLPEEMIIDCGDYPQLAGAIYESIEYGDIESVLEEIMYDNKVKSFKYELFKPNDKYKYVLEGEFVYVYDIEWEEE